MLPEWGRLLWLQLLSNQDAAADDASPLSAIFVSWQAAAVTRSGHRGSLWTTDNPRGINQSGVSLMFIVPVQDAASFLKRSIINRFVHSERSARLHLVLSESTKHETFLMWHHHGMIWRSPADPSITKPSACTVQYKIKAYKSHTCQSHVSWQEVLKNKLWFGRREPGASDHQALILKGAALRSHQLLSSITTITPLFMEN